jgi:hypothetical protein
MHHAGAPEIHSRINLGIAKGEITTTAIQQATTELDVHKAALAASIRDELIASVKRELGLPIGPTTALPIIDVPEDQIRFTPAPRPPYPVDKDKADQPQAPLPQ